MIDGRQIATLWGVGRDLPDSASVIGPHHWISGREHEFGFNGEPILQV